MEQSYSMRSGGGQDGQANRRADMSKLIVGLYNFSNNLKKKKREIEPAKTAHIKERKE